MTLPSTSRIKRQPILAILASAFPLIEAMTGLVDSSTPSSPTSFSCESIEGKKRKTTIENEIKNLLILFPVGIYQTKVK